MYIYVQYLFYVLKYKQVRICMCKKKEFKTNEMLSIVDSNLEFLNERIDCLDVLK